ncbi:hypothetical protein P8452_22212 [Trifolium repens]|nr:hypothetical protein P8452_22212 [Trifolium repens]
MNQVRKKLSDIITDLHQLVAPFGKELDDPLTIIYEKKMSSINAIVEVLELALKVRVNRQSKTRLIGLPF